MNKENLAKCDNCDHIKKFDDVFIKNVSNDYLGFVFACTKCGESNCISTLDENSETLRKEKLKVYLQLNTSKLYDLEDEAEIYIDEDGNSIVDNKIFANLVINYTLNKILDKFNLNLKKVNK